jgi:predicted acyltransferase
MIVVNNPGSWDHVYWPLLHAPWHGWTGADLIFPLFLFIVGVSISTCFRLDIARRSIVPCSWPGLPSC